MTRASMKRTTAVALLFAISILPAAALEASVGGGNGSLSASVTGAPGGTGVNVTLGGGRTASGTVGSGANGGTGVTATVGGGTNIGKATVGSGGNTATVSIGGGNGPLVSGSSNGNPLTGTSSTAAAVNLGGLGTLLPGVPGVAGGGGGGTGGISGGTGGGAVGGGGGVVHDPGRKTITSAKVQRVVDSLSVEERRKLKLRCSSILMSPAAFDDGLVGLCRMLRGL